MSKKNFSIALLLISLGFVGFFVIDRSGSESKHSDKETFAGNIYERDYSISIGPEAAPVTIVEFFDPACEACRAFYPIVKQIMSRHPNEIRLVYRYAAFHPGSETIVKVLEAARAQGKFATTLEALLADQHLWASHHKPNIAAAWGLAENSGLDIVSARKLVESSKYDSLLAQENADIRALQITHTPTFFVNERPLEKFGPEPLYQLIAEEIKKTKR